VIDHYEGLHLPAFAAWRRHSLLASWKQSTSGCSTVAVNRLYLGSRGFLFIDSLPANLEKNKEPTSGLELLTCSLRVAFGVFRGVGGCCKTP
jgi:hypothetical protein